MRSDERTGLYFDLLGRLYLDPEQAEGEGGALVPLSPAETALVEHRIREALLEAVAKLTHRRRRVVTRSRRTTRS